MKNKFNKKWKGSKQPKKQKKYLFNAPLHIKKKMVRVNLSKELRKKYGKRNLPLRKGDIVKILRGKFKEKKGKVVGIKLKKLKVQVEGMQMKKQDGSKTNVNFSHSNLQIQELNLEDRKRSKSLGKEIKTEPKEKKEDKEKGGKK
jgi:large subunit ribosomal protein L24